MIIAMAEVATFKPKPRPATSDTVRAARFDGTTESMVALLRVAKMADDHALVANVPTLDAAVVRWLCVDDDHPARREYEVVERGKWLAFSDTHWLLYSTDDANLEQWYDRT